MDRLHLLYIALSQSCSAIFPHSHTFIQKKSIHSTVMEQPSGQFRVHYFDQGHFDIWPGRATDKIKPPACDSWITCSWATALKEATKQQTKIDITDLTVRWFVLFQEVTTNFNLSLSVRIIECCTMDTLHICIKTFVSLHCQQTWVILDVSNHLSDSEPSTRASGVNVAAEALCGTGLWLLHDCQLKFRSNSTLAKLH